MCNPQASYAACGVLAAKELESIPLVCYNEKDYQRAIDAVVGVSGMVNIAMSNSNQRAIMGYLQREKEAGVILDEFSYRHRPQPLQDYLFVPFAEAPQLVVGFAYNQSSPRAAQFKRFIEEFLRAYREL